MAVKFHLLRLLRIAMPVLKSAVPQILAMTQPDSEGGKKVSSAELEGLAADIGLKVGDAILRELRRSRDVIDSE